MNPDDVIRALLTLQGAQAQPLPAAGAPRPEPMKDTVNQRQISVSTAPGDSQPRSTDTGAGMFGGTPVVVQPDGTLMRDVRRLDPEQVLTPAERHEPLGVPEWLSTLAVPYAGPSASTAPRSASVPASPEMLLAEETRGLDLSSLSDDQLADLAQRWDTAREASGPLPVANAPGGTGTVAPRARPTGHPSPSDRNAALLRRLVSPLAATAGGLGPAAVGAAVAARVRDALAPAPQPRATLPATPPRPSPHVAYPQTADMTFVRPPNPPPPSDRGQVVTDHGGPNPLVGLLRRLVGGR